MSQGNKGKLEDRAQKAVSRKKQEMTTNTKKEKSKINVNEEVSEKEKGESKTNSRGVYTTTYEDIYKNVDQSDSGSESQDSSVDANHQEETKDDFERRVEKYIKKIFRGHEKYDETERKLKDISPKVPRKWMFGNIHYKQEKKWGTAATLRGWLIEQKRKNRGDLEAIADWISTVDRILIDFFEFETTTGLQAKTDDLYEQIWLFYHGEKDPLDKIGDLYE